MLISRISDENEKQGDGDRVDAIEEPDSSQGYHTASELFELMTKNCQFNDNVEESLTTQDLVLLYKNIDIGTRLMSEAHEVHKRPNQRVESIVYNDDPDSDSDISENLSVEDLQHLFKVNQERLNLFHNGSFDNVLCHKLGGLEISPNAIPEYNKQFIFKDPYIKDQLKSLKAMTSCSESENVFPTSLLDYICCKRLEDNYNFYMENIIKYVTNTIDQLKRISNGEYLTDRVKEKWEEINKTDGQENSNTKVLATSTSIPLQVVCKKRGNVNWDDIVHSEIDVRSLSKILEKKMVVELPKLLCGSYRLFSKCCADNLVISCKREKQEDADNEARVDVVLQLERSQTGQVISNINSIMVLQKAPAMQNLCTPSILPITYNETILDEDPKEAIVTVSITECSDDEDDGNLEIMTPPEYTENENLEIMTPADILVEKVKSNEQVPQEEDRETESNEQVPQEEDRETDDYPLSERTGCAILYDSIQYSSSKSSIALKDILLDKPGMLQMDKDASFKLLSPDDLRISMQRLTMQSALPEESGEDASAISSKKRSPTRVRIKSPYENKLHAMEEKKRKKFLEIKEKREKKKMALGENAKVNKFRYGKSTEAPQPSGSVTKLSITNKSFYNSIYGRHLDDKSAIARSRRALKGPLTIEVPIEQIQEENCDSQNDTPESSKKYINRSYYLDDTETEMMYMEMNKESRNTCSASTSAVSNDFGANLTLLSQLVGPFNGSQTDLCKEELEDQESQSIDEVSNNSDDAGCSSKNPLEESKNPPEIMCEPDDESLKFPVSIQCKNSIDKLYKLMNKLGKSSNSDLNTISSRQNIEPVQKLDATTGDSTIQGSDSGTSVKHHLTSSNPSVFSFEKTHLDPKSKKSRKKQQADAVVPKVIISSKLQVAKLETDKLKKDRRKHSPSSKHAPENPLKAISQLLHEFDNVQKTRQRATPDVKTPKKSETVPIDGRTLSQQNSFRRRSRIDQQKEHDHEKKTVSPRDKRSKPLAPSEIIKAAQLLDDKHTITKKKIADILDEAKEARGEAVRGPSKTSSRLNTLAQPKRYYVQAHKEEYQSKHGRTLMADRLQRLARAGSPPPAPTPAETIVRNALSPILKNKKREVMSTVSVRPAPAVQSLDKPVRPNSSICPLGPPAVHKYGDSEVPATLEKMVAVESYLQNHYGSKSSQAELAPPGRSSRVPLVPTDIDLVSVSSSPDAGEANELGERLHHMIDSIVTPADPDVSPLHSHIASKSNHRDIVHKPAPTSDYNLDIFKDNVITAVENSNKLESLSIYDFSAPDRHDLQRGSFIELQKLQNGLFNETSGDQKQLSIKKVSLTPKQSLQQVFLLQSGDTGSLIVKSKVSSLRINKCATDILHDLQAVKVLSNSHLNWNFSQIPMQIATVGYAFPVYQRASNLNVKSLSLSKISLSEQASVEKTNKSDKVSQCFKGVHQEPKFERALQVDVADSIEHESHSHTTQSEENVSKISEDILNILTEDGIPKAIQNLSAELDENKTPAEKPNTSEVSSHKAALPNSDDVGYTTSLDMLVGLLNEIQKITCQKPGNHQCNELETMLDNAAALEKEPCKLAVSVTSIDKLRRLESSPSIYSFYNMSLCDEAPSSRCFITDQEHCGGCFVPNPAPIVDGKGKEPFSISIKPDFVDKEVNVNIYSEKEHVNTFTDVPSLMPMQVNHSTNVTNSLIGVISEPSSQSSISFKDYRALYSNAYFSSQSIKRIIELPQIESKEKLKEVKKTDLNKRCAVLPAFETVPPTFEVERLTDRHVCKLNNRHMKRIDFDSSIKIKRDILVTVYSILMLTVFAALSFPDLTSLGV